MKIFSKEYSQEYEVYGLYFIDNVTYFYVLSKNYDEGMMVLDEKDCDVVDSKIERDFIFYKNDQDEILIINRHLISNNLLDKLIENEPNAKDKLANLEKNEFKI